MGHTTNNLTLVCYDITSDRLRRKIDKSMKDFGIRLQRSVFICRLNADGIMKCRKKLVKVLNTYHNEQEPSDSLIIFERLNPDMIDCILNDKIKMEASVFRII